MATKYWVGRAHSVKQISTITVANTWAAGDTAVLKINEKELTITCGSTTTTTATVAAAISEAWNAAGRLDGTSNSSNATSNFGGQEFGEFREAVATVSGSVVTLTANTAGKPFTLTVTETTAGSGTATGATAQAATGRNHWDNADNWIDSLDLTTGSTGVPANDDVVDFRNTDISCLYGLPNNSKEVTFNVWKSYTGEIGLPAINRDDPSYPYPEYRQRYVRLDDAGTGTNIAHRFGLGTEGTGCRLCNIKHSTLKCSPVVYATGTPRIERIGEKALNICCTASTSQLNILGGSVDWGSQDGGTSAWNGVYQNGGESIGANGLNSSGSAVLRSGAMTVSGTGNILLLSSYGGTLRAENVTGTVTSAYAFDGGTIRYASTGTITNVFAYGGTFDCSDDAGTFTATNSTVKTGGKVRDPYRRITFSNPMQVYFELSDAITLGVNDNQPVDISFS